MDMGTYPVIEQPRLAWPRGGHEIANLAEAGRSVLLDEMNHHHWNPAVGAVAYCDRLTLDDYFQDYGQASRYAAMLVAANAENLSALATLYRNESSLTLAHYSIARAFIEWASSAWWLLSPGFNLRSRNLRWRIMTKRIALRVNALRVPGCSTPKTSSNGSGWIDGYTAKPQKKPSQRKDTSQGTETSKHHAIQLRRIEQWKDRWDQLGIFDAGPS